MTSCSGPGRWSGTPLTRRSSDPTVRAKGGMTLGHAPLSSAKVAARTARARLFAPHHRAAIDLVGRDDRDLGVRTLGRRQDLLVRGELVRSEARVEDDQVLVPQRV